MKNTKREFNKIIQINIFSNEEINNTTQHFEEFGVPLLIKYKYFNEVRVIVLQQFSNGLNCDSREYCAHVILTLVLKCIILFQRWKIHISYLKL